MLNNFNYNQIKGYIESLGYEVKTDIYLCDAQRDFMLSVCLEGEGLQAISGEEFQMGPGTEMFCLVTERPDFPVRFDFFTDFDIYKEDIIDAYLDWDDYINCGLYWVSKYRKTPLAVWFTAFIEGRNMRGGKSYLDIFNFGEIRNGKIRNRAVMEQPSDLQLSQYKFYEDLEPSKKSKYDHLADMGPIVIQAVGLLNMLELVAYEEDDTGFVPSFIYDLFPRYYASIKELEEAAVYFKRNPQNAKYGIAAINNNGIRKGVVDAEAGTVEWEASLEEYFHHSLTRWAEIYEEGLK